MKSSLNERAHADEESRPDALSRRHASFKDQTRFDRQQLIFIDAAWASTKMPFTHGRRLRSARAAIVMSG